MKAPFRKKVYACIHPETFKYYFDRSCVDEAWQILQSHYGAIEYHEATHVMEICSDKFIFRSSFERNPITVIRTRECQDIDVSMLHKRIDFNV